MILRKYAVQEIHCLQSVMLLKIDAAVSIGEHAGILMAVWFIKKNGMAASNGYSKD